MGASVYKSNNGAVPSRMCWKYSHMLFVIH